MACFLGVLWCWVGTKDRKIGESVVVFGPKFVWMLKMEMKKMKKKKKCLAYTWWWSMMTEKILF